MHVESFGECCGAVILEDFGWTAVTVGTNRRVPKDNIRIFLEQTIYNNSHLALITVILNPPQTRNLGKIFEEHGFQPVAKGYNDNHNNVLTLYVRAQAKVRQLIG